MSDTCRPRTSTAAWYTVPLQTQPVPERLEQGSRAVLQTSCRSREDVVSVGDRLLRVLKQAQITDV